MKVLVAGTFNVFHDGHRILLDRAVSELKDRDSTIIVGITTDAYAASYKKVPVRRYLERCLDVYDYLMDKGVNMVLVPIDGPGIPPKLKLTKDDVLVCSTETEESERRAAAEIPEEDRPRISVVYRDPDMPSSSELWVLNEYKRQLRERNEEYLKRYERGYVRKIVEIPGFNDG